MKLVSAICGVTILIAAWASPAPAQPAVTLAFATLDTGSAWYVYGATIAELLRKSLPAGSNVDVKPRAGGVGNPRLVAKNETPHRSLLHRDQSLGLGRQGGVRRQDRQPPRAGRRPRHLLSRRVVSQKLPINSLQRAQGEEAPGQARLAAGGLARRVRHAPAPPRVRAHLRGRQGAGAARPPTSATTSSSTRSTTGAPTCCRGDHAQAPVGERDRDLRGREVPRPRRETIHGLAPLGYTAATMAANTFKGQASRSRRWASRPW